MKTSPSRNIAFAIAGLLTIGVAPALGDDAAPPHQEACPFTDRLQHWKDVDRQTAIIDMGVSHHYKVTFVGDCRDMRYALFARVQSRPGICLSAGDTITFGQPHGMETVCVVQSVELLPPSEPKPAAAPSH